MVPFSINDGFIQIVLSDYILVRAPSVLVTLIVTIYFHLPSGSLLCQIIFSAGLSTLFKHYLLFNYLKSSYTLKMQDRKLHSVLLEIYVLLLFYEYFCRVLQCYSIEVSCATLC